MTRALRLSTADDTALRGVNRLVKLAWRLSHDADGNPLPPQPPPLPIQRRPSRPGDVPTFEQMMVVVRPGPRGRRRHARRVERAGPPQLELLG